MWMEIAMEKLSNNKIKVAYQNLADKLSDFDSFNIIRETERDIEFNYVKDNHVFGIMIYEDFDGICYYIIYENFDETVIYKFESQVLEYIKYYLK